MELLQEEPQSKKVHIFSSFIVSNPYLFPKTITGIRLKFIKWLMWINILLVASKIFGNPFKAFKQTRQLKKIRDQYRNQREPVKYVYANNKYFVNYNTPGWPSKAFNRYITHVLNRSLLGERTSLHTLVFAITKKMWF